MAKKRRIKIKLDKKSPVTAGMVRELNSLFSFTSPGQLKDILTELYLNYCMNLEDLPADHKSMTEDVYILLQFLKKCEEQIQKQPNQ